MSDIRPIGILSVLWKTCEAAMKKLMEKYCLELLEVGPEQAGFAKYRCTLDH